MYESDLVITFVFDFQALQLTPTSLLTHTHTHTHTPHYLPVEAVLIYIVCSLGLHFSFPLRIEADTHMADEQPGETAGS